ncbi:scarecrow-like protein 32 [Zingiber officinale]|uniref:scarecrow-like protein 32 n=1 Tax=Zingiber officinale TaxID=94328 RepID=UPI001C4BE5AB|nr:scarecrow-like protein 32 [Zingiber officinale]
MMQYFTSAPVLPPAPLLPNGDGIVFYSDDDDEAASSSSKPHSCLQYLPQHHSWPWLPGLVSSSSSSSSPKPDIGVGGGSISSAGCMEQLLVHCATAIEANDATLAQQIIWVLNNIAPSDGDSDQRLASAFLRALIVRASKTGSCENMLVAAAAGGTNLALYLHRFSAVDLASFIDLTPWHRFGFAAANTAIAEAVEGLPAVHLVDLGTTHCMQMPTLIDLLAKRPEGPPLLRLTVPALTATAAPPLLDMSYDELGARLVNFARSRNIQMEFLAVPSDPTEAFATLMEQVRVRRLVTQGEAVIVNCHMMLHCIPEETAAAVLSSPSPTLSPRSTFLKTLRGLEPTLVTVVDEDADLTPCDLMRRLRAAFNYLWIPYDAVETCVGKGSEQRRWYEGGVCWKIENVIAQEGTQRVERQETKGRWAGRMRAAGFRSVGLTEEAAAEVRGMLDEHAAGWGMKRDDDHDLTLTWKGHNVVFATAWIPAP